MATYQQSITALVDGLKTLFENRTCTEAQALANATSKPNTIYYTSDTHCVVVGGQIYGRGQQLSSVFRFCPSGSVPGQDPDFSDPDYIYIVPDGTSFTLYWLNPGGAWSHTTGFQFDIATSAEDISYDLTQTPDLGTGNVQSAIEALDGKVEAVDARIDDEKVEFIKERFPSKNVSNYTRHIVNYKFEWVNGQAVYTANTSYRVGYYSKLVPKGSLCQLSLYYTSAPSTWGGLSMWGYSTTNIDDYIAENGSIVGLPTIRIKHIHGNGLIRDYLFIMPEDGYLIYAYQNTYSPTIGTSLIYDANDLTDLYTEYYKKGVADGAGMASIVGLGYNIYDYITGAVNMAGFEYGCKLYRASQALSGACADRYKNNTSLVYFPKFDMSAVTTWGSIFNGCTKLQVVPDLNVSSPTGSYQFSGCTNLLEVGDIGSESGTISVYYMFQNCTHLRRVGSIHAKISGSTGRMFYMTSALTHIESINFSLQTTVYTNTGNQTFTSTSNLRYVVLKYLGTPSNCTALNLSLITNWGVATTAEPDARQSLIDTLITYSFDRVMAGYSACTITLSANTKALLTEEEIEQITAKGYTIA